MTEEAAGTSPRAEAANIQLPLATVQLVVSPKRSTRQVQMCADVRCLYTEGASKGAGVIRRVDGQTQQKPAVRNSNMRS